MKDVFFFAFCVNIDSDKTFYREKEKKKKNRELLKRRINDGTLFWHFMSELWYFSAPFKLSPKKRGKNRGGQNMTSKCPG